MYIIKIASIAFLLGLHGSGFCAFPAEAARQRTQRTLSRNVERADLLPFSAWAARYIQAADPADKNRLLAEGVRLAKARRAVLSSLIRTDPQSALASSLSRRMLLALPREVTDELEKPVSGVGSFEVRCAFPEKTHRILQTLQRVVRLNGVTYSASVYGRRWFQASQVDVPLHGVVVDGVIALHEGALRELGPDEMPDASQEVIDMPPEPKVVSAVVPVPIRVLTIRVDFSDLPGDPARTNSAASVQAFMDNEIRAYYLQSSYGRILITNTVTLQLYRMPQTAVSYATRLFADQLRYDAETAASADYDLSNYDRMVFLFSWLGDLPGSQIGWGGLACVGDTNVWVNGELDFRVVAHELGHTFGLWHAGLWQTTNGDPVSDAGSFCEYDDLFDTMGANYGNDTRTDFNPCFKRQLNWIDETQVQTVAASGIYRVHRIDGPTATNILALKVVKDSSLNYTNGPRNYWITCRRNFTENRSMMHGAYISWGWDWPRCSYLINAGNPGGSALLAALPIDRTLIDPQANITITPVAEGGDSPNEYLDLQISFGPPPIISNQSTTETVIAGQIATLSVQANGTPPPAYQWECRPNGATAWVPLSDNDIYSGSQSASLAVRVSTLAMNGEQFRCVLTNSSGGFNCTQPAVLTVLETGVSTVAGETGVSGNVDGTGTTAQFNSPAGLAVDSAGTVWVADSGNSMIRRITSAGEVSTRAGGTGTPHGGDGVGSNASFRSPVALALDRAGSLYVVDQGNSTVSQVRSDGRVSTLAGTAGLCGSADGRGTMARFSFPSGITVDAVSNVYVADTANHTIRRIGLDGLVITFAGVAGAVGNTDGVGPGAHFNSPTGLACDRFGNVYVADQANCTIRKITPGALVSTLAGLAGKSGTNDGVGSSARFNYPAALAVDPSGNLYVADRNNSTIRKISPAGVVSTLAGVPGRDGSTDGTLEVALFMCPSGVALDTQGLLYVADTLNNTIRLVRGAVDSVPALGITPTGDGVLLAWPLASGRFGVETSSEAAGAAWIALTNEVTVSGGNCVLRLNVDAAKAFYRLHR